MRRYVPALLLLAACSQLTSPPSPPPVALSVVTGQVQASAEEDILGSAPQSVRLLRAVSPKTLLTVHVPDLKSAIDRLQKTGLVRWLSSPEMRQDFEDGPSLFSMSMAAAPPEMQQLMRAIRGEVIVCLESVDPAASNPMDAVRVLAGANVRGSEKAIEDAIASATAMAATIDGVHVEKGTVAGMPYSRVVVKRPAPWVAEVALYRDALIVGFGRETVTAALDRLVNEEMPSIAEEPAFQASMGRCGDPRDAIRVHIATGAAFERFSPMLPPEATRVLNALGLNHVRSLAMAVRCEGTDLVLSTLVDSPGGKDILTQLLSSHTIDRSFLERLPADTSSFSLFAIDGKRLVEAARTALPEEGRQVFEDMLKALREGGVDIETDVLDVFGPRCALVNVPTDRPDGPGLDAIWGQFLSTALICEIQDPTRARTILDRLPERGTTATRRALLVEGIPGFAYRFETDELPQDFSICYALTENYLVVAASEEAFKRMLRRRSPQTAERFRGLLREVPETAAIVSFDDLRKGPGMFLDSIVSGLPGGTPLPGERRRLSPASGLLRELGPSLSWTVADSRGILSVTRSPTGGFGGMGGLGGLMTMAAIAVPNLRQARVEANEAAAVSTLRAIATAEQTFRTNVLRDEDNDGDGEYGYLSELLGQPRPGEKRARTATPLVSGTFQRDGKDFARGGYRFRVYLPAEDGSPIGENEKPARIERVDGDLAETVVVVVAWPVSKGMSGHRAFYLDGEGRLFACVDGPYAGEDAPPADILSSQEKNLASKPLREAEPTRDGSRWLRLR